jgi:creatinine amidohydrolase
MRVPASAGQPPRRYGDLASPEVPGALAHTLVILPFGAVEQHGPHLPLTVDLDIAEALAAELATGLGGCVAPSITYSARSLPQSGGGPSFPGTIAVRGRTLIDYLVDVLGAYARTGARRVLVVNGHYENEPFLFEAIEVCREAGQLDGVEVIALSWWSVVSDEVLRELFGDAFPGWHAEHAGLCETSLMLHLRPETVRSVRPEHPEPPRAGVYLHPIDPERISDRGVLARTSGASAETGHVLFAHVCAEFAELVRAPHGLSRGPD